MSNAADTHCTWLRRLAPWCIALLGGGTAAADTATAPTAQPIPLTAQSRWSIRLPAESPVRFRGATNLDQTGIGGQAMMYPAPSAAGLLAAILTHGFLVESQKDEQQKKLQAEADRVLVPYGLLVATSTHEKLAERVLPLVPLPGQKAFSNQDDKRAGDWWIDIRPVYTMTQDQSSLILDAAMSIYMSTAPDTQAYQNTVRVVSRAQRETDLPATWSGNEGQRWHGATAAMLAQAVSIAVRDWQGTLGGHATPQRTVRFAEGHTERMERAQVLSEECENSVIKTLRGWLMVIPTRESVQQKLGCAVDAADPVPPASGVPVSAISL